MFKKLNSKFINDKKKQYSNENINYSNRLMQPISDRSNIDVNKLLQEWQSKQKCRPIEAEQKYCYTDNQMKFENPNIISKKQEKIEI